MSTKPTPLTSSFTLQQMREPARPTELRQQSIIYLAVQSWDGVPRKNSDKPP